MTFPPSFPNHNSEQTFYYDEKFMLRRQDYAPDATSGALIAFYGRRQMYLRDPDGIADKSYVPIVITTDDVQVERAG